MIPLVVALALGAPLALAQAPDPVITPAPSVHEVLARQAASTTTYETTSPLPLTEYFFPYSAIPYQVDPYPVGRGPQSGYNQCNSTTEGPDSQCQTGVFNSIDDFCLWGAPGLFPNETIGDVEAAVVAYCSKSGHGARIFPEGTFTSIQYMKTEAYIQIVGFFNQTSMGLDPTDPGGELDPHGADYLGNPLGGLFYSNGFASGDNVTYVQTQSWNEFVGSNQFCLKLCDPSYSTDLNYCQNIFDLLGCNYNMPANYTWLQSESVFVACEGDLQDEVGTYTSNGQTYTWSQPSSLPATSTLPWTPRIPASSNCVTYQSSDLFPAASLGYASTLTLGANAAVSTASSASAGSSAQSGSASASRTSGAASVSKSASASGSKIASASASATSKTSGASAVAPVVGVAALVAGFAALLA